MKKGFKLSEETKKKMSVSKIGKKRPDMSGNLNHNFGRNMSGDNNPRWKGGKKLKRDRFKINHPEVETFNGMSRRAKEKNIPFCLTITEFREWYNSQIKVCSYCKIPVERKAIPRWRTLSIDRKYNEIGYVSGNLCFSCYRCNAVKSNVFTYDQMREIAEKYLIVTST